MYSMKSTQLTYGDTYMVTPKHTPRYNVISMSVCDTERLTIQRIAQQNTHEN